MGRKESSDSKDTEKIKYVTPKGYQYTEEEWVGSSGCAGVLIIVLGVIGMIIGYIIGDPVLTLGGGLFILAGILSIIRYKIYKFRKR